MKDFFLIAGFLLAFMNLTPGYAGNVFTVDKIRVDARADSTTQARTKALRIGQHKAMAVMLRRLSRKQEWNLLPDVRTLDVDSLVEGFRVSGEKTSPGRYLATLSIQFKPNPLRRLLLEEGIAVSGTQNRSALLLPVLETPKGLQLWGKNWWRESWLSRDLNNNPAPLTLPLGDLDDRKIATAEDVLNGHSLKLRQLNRRYATDTAIVVHALADVNGQLGVTAYIFEPTKSDVIVKTYRSGESPQKISSLAIDDLMAILAERWKQVAAVIGDEVSRLQIRVDYKSLNGWRQVLTRFNEVDLVREVTIIELSAAHAYLDIAYIGSITQLTDGLRRRELALSEAETGWQVAATRAY